MSRRDTVLHLIGWLLFLVCAVLFLVSGVRAADTLLVIGSILFLIACVLFIVPLVFRYGAGTRNPEEEVR